MAVLFVDAAPWVDDRPEFAALFREMGCEAYDAIFAILAMEAREQDERDYREWTTWKPGPLDEDEDDFIDLGAGMPDDYDDGMERFQICLN